MNWVDTGIGEIPLLVQIDILEDGERKPCKHVPRTISFSMAISKPFFLPKIICFYSERCLCVLAIHVCGKEFE